MDAQASLKCLQMTPISAWVQFDIVQSNQRVGDERNLEINKWFEPKKTFWGRKKNVEEAEKLLTNVVACFVKIRLTQLTIIITVWKHSSKIFIFTFLKNLLKISGKCQWNVLGTSTWHLSHHHCRLARLFLEKPKHYFEKVQQLCHWQRAQTSLLCSDCCSYINPNCTQMDKEEKLLQQVST